MIRLLIAVLLSIIAAESSACSRCGLFGRRCRFAVVEHVPHVAVAQVVATPPQNLVIQNNYNAPNGAAALIAPQGGTVYGLQAVSQAYTLDPAAVLRQAAELTRGAQQLAQQGLTGYNTTASLALTLNAAQPAIRAAIVSQPQQRSVTQSLRLLQQSDGSWKVETSAAEQAAPAPAQPDLPEPQSPAPAAVNGGALLKQHCSSCHGSQSATPKGGLYFDQGVQLDCKSSLSAVRAVLAGKMPKGVQLPPEVRAALVQELVALSVDP